MSSDLRQNAISRYFEQQSGQFNALKQFTSVFDPKTMKGSGGAKSVFIEKTDLSKGGAQSVVFNTIGIPSGPGAVGDEELTGRTSSARKGTYKTNVDWVRDAVEFTADEIEMLTPGRSLEQTTVDLLAEKMGLVKQNHQLKRLIEDADDNIYRPNNRASTGALTPTDTLTLDITTNARARLSTMGAKPLACDTARSGCPINKYLIFGSETSLLPIRNDSSFQTAIQQADERGKGNAQFTGEILNWQGNPFYEFPVTDQDWDDFQGGPLIAKAEQGTAFGVNSAIGACKLIVNSANTKSRYFQWFDGYEFVFNRIETPADLSSNEYYAWIVNPDGSVGFVAYAGGFDGNQITITKILSFDGTDTSTLGETTVGELITDTAAWTGGASTLEVSGPNGTWVYTDSFVAGAKIFQANAKGVPYSRSFVFGAMAATFAHGRVRMTEITQDRDYDFVKGRGFQMIFGTAVCKNTNSKPRNYLLIEHAISHPGYPVPELA
tara:strand:- start:4176 stop:5654 length:1479 start_codon:yes stop_codon:yes gene_type:complete